MAEVLMTIKPAGNKCYWCGKVNRLTELWLKFKLRFFLINALNWGCLVCSKECEKNLREFKNYTEKYSGWVSSNLSW